MTRRIAAITVAIVLAALGAAGGLFLIVTADQRAQDRIETPVTVAIATKRLAAGTSGARMRDQKLVRFERVPRALAPADVLSAIGPEFDKQVLTSNIAAGQMLLKANFGAPSGVTSGLPIEDGKIAVTVQTGVPEQVAGFVQVGAQIAIFLTYNVVDKDGTRTGLERTRVLLPRVEVLAIGTYQVSASATSTSRSGALMITVAVTQADAERLIEGLNHGTLYLGLLTDSADVRSGPGVDDRDSANTSLPLFK